MKRKDNMTDTGQQLLLARQAVMEIEELLRDYDSFAQIEIALPLLRRHHRTLGTLRNALLPVPASKVSSDNRWVDDLVAVYKELRGQAPDSVVYRRMKQLRQNEGRSWPTNARSVIRQVRQAHNIESPQYKGGLDLFRMVQRGLWRVKENS
jgi:hypothetical protein